MLEHEDYFCTQIFEILFIFMFMNIAILFYSKYEYSASSVLRSFDVQKFRLTILGEK